MYCKPLHDKILVRVIEGEKVSDGGIVIPDAAVEKPNEGIVLAVGPGKHLPNGEFQVPVLKENDRIIFGKNAGYKVKMNNEELIMLKEEEVYAKVT